VVGYEELELKLKAGQ